MGKPEGCQVLEIYFAPEEPKCVLNKWEAKILLVEGKQFFSLIESVMDGKEEVEELNKYLKYHENLKSILQKWVNIIGNNTTKGIIKGE